jgi:hypothetical protein
MTRSPLAAVLALTALLGLAACSREAAHPRCAQCGMLADSAPRFAAGAEAEDGSTLRFDTPKCLFRYLGSARGRGVHEAWVTSYYDQHRLPAERALYVVGSDLRSPMGEDLVPVADAEAAAQLAGDHGGHALAADAIDPALLAGLL